MERMQNYSMSVEINKDRRDELEKILRDFLKGQKIKLKVPVDVFALATELDFDVRGAEFKENVDGLIIVDENKEFISEFVSNKVIVYNCKKDIFDKKFNVAHELAHYIYAKNENKNRKLILALRDHNSDYSNDEKEQEMDYIAAAILMPRDSFEKIYSKNSNDSSLADYYKVSEKLAHRRVLELVEQKA